MDFPVCFLWGVSCGTGWGSVAIVTPLRDLDHTELALAEMERRASSPVRRSETPPLHGRYATARSVISRPLSMMANASRSCCSLTHRGGLVKNVFQRTNV